MASWEGFHTNQEGTRAKQQHLVMVSTLVSRPSGAALLVSLTALLERSLILQQLRSPEVRWLLCSV